MKTWFVRPDGACYSVYREGVSSLENLGFALKMNLLKYGSLVAIITEQNIWLAAEQKHLDDFIDQCIERLVEDKKPVLHIPYWFVSPYPKA